MYSSLEINLPINDVEAVVTICTKSLENADQATRHALSQLVGHMLASTQSERIITVAEAPQKGKNQAENETDVPVPSHVLGESKKTMLTPGDMLALLSTQFNKVNVSRKVRIGLFDFYAALLTKLGLSFVENQYALIVGHLMNEIVSHLRNSTTRYETLLVRSLVGILLRDLIGVRMLSEQGQIGAIQDLSNSYLKRWPAMMPGQVSPSPLVLAIVLKEVAGLLQQLGNAPPPVQVSHLVYITVSGPNSIALGRRFRAFGDTTRSSQPYSSCQCFVGSSLLLLLDTIAVTENYTRRHGDVATGPSIPLITRGPIGRQPTSPRPRIRTGCTGRRYSATPTLCVI